MAPGMKTGGANAPNGPSGIKTVGVNDNGDGSGSYGTKTEIMNGADNAGGKAEDVIACSHEHENSQLEAVDASTDSHIKYEGGEDVDARNCGGKDDGCGGNGDEVDGDGLVGGSEGAKSGPKSGEGFAIGNDVRNGQTELVSNGNGEKSSPHFFIPGTQFNFMTITHQMNLRVQNG